MNVPHAFSLSLSHTHKHTYVCIYMYTYIYIYILLAAHSKSPIAASSNRGGDESEDNSKCNNTRRTISTCAHRIRCKHTKSYRRHMSECNCAQFDDIIYKYIYIHTYNGKCTINCIPKSESNYQITCHIHTNIT
jgi:hypothetical protein